MLAFIGCLVSRKRPPIALRIEACLHRSRPHLSGEELPWRTLIGESLRLITNASLPRRPTISMVLLWSDFEQRFATLIARDARMHTVPGMCFPTKYKKFITYLLPNQVHQVHQAVVFALIPFLLKPVKSFKKSHLLFAHCRRRRKCVCTKRRREPQRHAYM